ncbi:MAG: hypothetical protein CVU71_16415 [Deltaproteobacteria bacterium HGW-Deltaproteobacteria-6]|nr:MAG: hypothetical protein CVU71_16415 [Deltaproteobacteria bacterium HGW-Deltaproteobacteria-6]
MIFRVRLLLHDEKHQKVHLKYKMQEENNEEKRLYSILLPAIFGIALGGWLLHLRIHPISKDAEN